MLRYAQLAIEPMTVAQVAIPPLWAWLLFCYLLAGIPFTAVMAFRAWLASRKQHVVRAASLCTPQNILYASLFNGVVTITFVAKATKLQKLDIESLFYVVCLLVAPLFSALACWRPPSNPR